MNQTYTVRRVTTFTAALAISLRKLAEQLGDNYQELTDQDIQEMLASPNHHLFVAENEEGTIAGMILVLIARIPYIRKAYMEDFVVDDAFRGRGIGTDLIQHALTYAQEQGAAYADFTSHPSRVAGNALYEKLGLQKRETNVYRKIFHDGKTN